MKIGIGNDHAAVDMKNEISEYLKEKGYEVVNYGTDSNESCDYPVYGEKVETAKMIVDEWLNAEFMGGKHERRVNMLMDIEKRKIHGDK